MQIFIIIMIPLAGTVLGAAMVLFMRKQVNTHLEKLLLGFAAGVMSAASVWSLLIPSLEIGEESSQLSWIPAVAGLVMGIGFLMLLDKMIPKMLFFAITLHNFPEGMAVGAIIAGVMAGAAGVTMAGAFILALGIAIQNIPEGAIVSMPMRSSGMSRKKAFGFGVISGIAEPVGAVLTILVSAYMVPLLPYFLSFAAGAMIYVVINELVPEMNNGKHFDFGTLGTAVGFCVMMVLDVSLG